MQFTTSLESVVKQLKSKCHLIKLYAQCTYSTLNTNFIKMICSYLMSLTYWFTREYQYFNASWDCTVVHCFYNVWGEGLVEISLLLVIGENTHFKIYLRWLLHEICVKCCVKIPHWPIGLGSKLRSKVKKGQITLNFKCLGMQHKVLGNPLSLVR